jgi:hypothetical protein
MDWIDTPQYRGRWGALVKVITNFGFHKMGEISQLAEDLSASEGLCAMDLVR